MVIGALTGEELVLVLGAYTALVLSAFGLLTKFVLDTRRQASETNTAVNNRPKDQPSLRDLVEHIDIDVRQLRVESFDRHRTNVNRLDRLSERTTSVERDLRQHMKDVDRKKGEGT